MRSAVEDRSIQLRLLAHDALALTELYSVLGVTVWKAAYRATADRQGAEDVTQDVFAALWAHPSTYNPDRGPMAPWLRTVARRKGIDWTRSQAAFRRRHLESALPDNIPDTAETYGAWADATAVRSAVAALPETERVPIEMAFFEGHTYRAVAAEIHVAEGTVKSRIRSGLARLADAPLNIC